MEKLGQILRSEREKRGLTIDALAQQTRINAIYFHAIEEGDRKTLPGGFFYRSFLRQYARLLDLPESVYQEEIARSLEQETQEIPAQPDRHIVVPPMPTGTTDRAAETRRWVIRLAGLVAVVALATMLYTVYLRWRTPSEVAENSAAEPPPIAMPAPAEPVPEPSGEVTPPPPAATLPDSAANTPPPSSNVPSETDPAAASGPVRLRLAATEAVWVEVWADGRRVFSNLMNASDARSFGAQTRIRVLLGNAGGMNFEWNGRAVDPVGPRGQVRTVEFGQDAFQVVAPAPPAPPSETTQPPPASA
jgi:cytoskeletal protein RodZ